MPSSAEREADAFEDPIDGALQALAADGLVAFPTETVWGIAACARSAEAVDALFAWKGRRSDQPVSVLVSGIEELEQLGLELSAAARLLCAAFWPGPLTLVLPAPAHPFADGIANGDGAVGLRCSSHPVTTALIRAAEARGLGPLTATSCNRSGEAPAVSIADARAVCGSAAGAPRVLEMAAGEAFGAEPSTVLACLPGGVRVLRAGAISLDEVRPVLAELSQTAELAQQEA